MVQNTQAARTEDLVDRLISIVFAEVAPEVKYFVLHRFPDDDCWLSLWIAKRWIPKTANAQLVFVRSGEALPGSEGDSSVVHLDTGGGEFDQHGLRMRRGSSAALLVEKLQIQDEALRPLLELVARVDNAEPSPLTDMHWIIEGYPRLPEFMGTDNSVDWDKVRERVFQLFDIVYRQEQGRMLSRTEFHKYAQPKILHNGLLVTTLPWNPNLREVAFERGAAVAIYTERRGKGFWVQIQKSRKYPQLMLDNVAAALRGAEARARNIPTNGKNLRQIGEDPDTQWFLHDSLAFVACGTRTHPLRGEELTKLDLATIVRYVHQALGAIPQGIVKSWGGNA